MGGISGAEFIRRLRGSGCQLPALALARAGANTLAALALGALLVPAAGWPLAHRAIALRSDQSITLSTGAVTLTLNAQGLARLVAHSIEQDARDLIDIDGADFHVLKSFEGRLAARLPREPGGERLEGADQRRRARRAGRLDQGRQERRCISAGRARLDVIVAPEEPRGVEREERELAIAAADRG